MSAIVNVNDGSVIITTAEYNKLRKDAEELKTRKKGDVQVNLAVTTIDGRRTNNPIIMRIGVVSPSKTVVLKSVEEIQNLVSVELNSAITIASDNLRDKVRDFEKQLQQDYGVLYDEHSESISKYVKQITALREELKSKKKSWF